MNKGKKFIKKNWIAIWIVVAIIGIASTVAFAEYMAESNRIKRVAANIAGAGQPFDSNYLSTGATLVSNIPFPGDTQNYCPIEIKIWNYNRANNRKAYKGYLTYDLVAQLVNSSGEKLENGRLGSYQISFSSDGGETYSDFAAYDPEKGYYMIVKDDCPFPANASGVYEPTEHNYILRFPAAFLTDDPGIYVKVIAIPSDNEKLSELSGIFGVTVQEQVISRVWEGRFNEDKSRTDYDSFNYVITGSGEAQITVSWCTEYLQMNDYNLSDYHFSPTDSTKGEGSNITHWKTISFSADSNIISRYDFQFYMTTALENALQTAIQTAKQQGASDDEIVNTYWNLMDQCVEFSSSTTSGD